MVEIDKWVLIFWCYRGKIQKRLKGEFMKKNAKLHNGHWERIRHRIITTPTANLTDTDILEGLLQFIYRRADTNEIAKNILYKFGNITTLLDATHDDMQNIYGLGETGIDKLLMLFKCIDYIKMEEARLIYSNPASTANAYDLVKHHFRNLDSEKLMVHYLNNQNQVVFDEVIGTSSEGLSVHIDYDRICCSAKLHRASKIVLTHNHPTGDPTPSEADYYCTCKLYAILRQNNIELLDHLILGGTDYYSFFGSSTLLNIATLYDNIMSKTEETLRNSKVFYIPK